MSDNVFDKHGGDIGMGLPLQYYMLVSSQYYYHYCSSDLYLDISNGGMCCGICIDPCIFFSLNHLTFLFFCLGEEANDQKESI